MRHTAHHSCKHDLPYKTSSRCSGGRVVRLLATEHTCLEVSPSARLRSLILRFAGDFATICYSGYNKKAATSCGYDLLYGSGSRI